MRGVLDLQVQVAAAAALPAEADRLPFAHALGDTHVQRPAVDADAHAVAAVDGLQWHRQLGARVASRLGATPVGRALCGATAAASEQFLEEVAESTARATPGKDLVVVEAARRPLAEPAVRRADLVAGAVAALPQLVVGRALLGVAQGLVRFVDGLELFLGAGFLAHVRVVLARQPPVGGLDLGLARARLHAEDPVVVLELHRAAGPCPRKAEG